MFDVAGPLAYARANSKRFLSELTDFVRIPTVSAQPRHKEDVKRGALWLAKHLRRAGLKNVKVIPTRRHPLVYADSRGRPDGPTVLFYGHYDVQPVDPVDEWSSPPFEPRVRGNDLYGRGASDDKGQLLAQIKALESCLRTAGGRLPINIKCIFEGEEEIGSPNLPSFLTRNSGALGADVAVLSDSSIPAPDRPAITCSLRGALSMELEVRGPEADLHSGKFGGAVHDPVQVLCEMIAGLHDKNRRIAIPGFYDRVLEYGEEERAYMKIAGPSDARITRDAQVEKGRGEYGFTQYERTTIRPALTISGITGGYQGKGNKSIIPALARAKLGFRLVKGQQPREIEDLVRRHIRRITPRTVHCSIRTTLSAKPIEINRNHFSINAAEAAYSKAFGSKPVFVRSGGTIPAVNLFKEILGVPTVLMGFGLPGDRIHAPDEKFHLPNFYKGIAACIRFLAEIASRRSLMAHPAKGRVKRMPAALRGNA